MNKLTKIISFPLISIAVVSLSIASVQANDIPSRGPTPFATYDADQNGSISEEEFTTAQAKRMGMRVAEGSPMRGTPPTFADFDKNNDGSLSTDELTQGQQAQSQKHAGKNMRQGAGRDQGAKKPDFASLDLNGDGCINAEEYASVSAGAKSGRGNMPTYTDFDTDNNGAITEQEFLNARGKRIAERAAQGRQMKGLANAPIFADIDTNKDGTLDQAEFDAQLQQHRQEH